MKIGIFFDSIAEGLAAIDLLTGNGSEPTEVVTAGTPDPVLGVELDSRGFPWVADVHAGTKGKNKDGSWKAKKGVDDAVRAAAEQAALAHLQSTAAAPVAAPVAAAPVVAPVAAAPAMPVGIVAAAMPPVPYEKLVEKYSDLAARGMIDMTKVTAIYAKCGVTDPNALATNETLCGAVYAELVALDAPAAMPGMPGMPGM
jgi:hypothetical protein